MLTKGYSLRFAHSILVFILLVGMYGFTPVQPVTAATLTVTNKNDSGAGSLRQAIASASSGDIITFASSLSGQTIILASTLVINKNLTINGSTLAPRVSISGNQTVGVFEIGAGINVALTGLNIVNGFIPTLGGAGAANHGTLNIDDSLFSGNNAHFGGGVINFGALTITNSIFSNNVAINSGAEAGGGGGIYNLGTLSIANSTFSGNSTDIHGDGGAITNQGSLTVAASTFSGNSAGGPGGGLNNSLDGSADVANSIFSGNSAALGGAIENYQTLNISNSSFVNNSGIEGGGGIRNDATLSVNNSTFSGNSAAYGGGLENLDTATVTNNLFKTNSSTSSGGGVYNGATLTSINNTLSGNTATNLGGGIDNDGTLEMKNNTFSDNSASSGGGITNTSTGTLNYVNTIIANSPLGNDCYNFGTISTNISNMVEDGSCPSSSTADPLLGVLANNGGLTQTMALIDASPAVDAGDDANCPATDQRGTTRPQGTQCDIGAYEYNPADINVFIGGFRKGIYIVPAHGSQRVSYAGTNDGPVELTRSTADPFLGAERVIYKVNGINTSFSEMMALPVDQISTTHWLPWYNNVDLDTQLRIGNVNGVPGQVHIFIAGDEVNGSPFNLAGSGAGQSLRLSFPNVNSGPVRIVADMNVVATERMIYKVNGTNTSFSELMALPNSQLTTTYWLPWYNNVDLDTQLRIGNVSGNPAQVHVFIAGLEVNGSPFNLSANGTGQSLRLSFPNANSGPVQIVADQNIVAAERVIYKVSGTNTSFSELMALPNSQLTTTYWLPWYNNVDLDTQLRIGNVSNATATVHIFIGGTEVTPLSGLTLLKGASTRVSYAGMNNGPVQIVSDQNLVVAERVIYKVNGTNTSFSELMALPNSQLTTTYWLPWYNNVDLDTQLRFGVP